jgi:hypothetical protein
VAEETLILRMASIGGPATAGEVSMVKGEVQGLEASTRRAGVEAERTGKKMGIFSKGVSVFRRAGVWLGIGALALGLKDLVGIGKQWEVQTANLAVSLHSAGVKGKVALSGLVDRAEQFSTKGGFSTPEQLSSLANFVRSLGSVNLAWKANVAATNLARGAHLSFQRAQRAIQSAIAGSMLTL